MKKRLSMALVLALMITGLMAVQACAESTDALQPGVPLELGGRFAVTALSFRYEDQIGYYRTGTNEVGDADDYYRASDGTLFALLRVKIRNMSDAPIDFLDDCEVTVQDGSDRYLGWAYQQNPDNLTLEGAAYGEDSGSQNKRWVIKAKDGFAIDPGEMGWYVFGCTLPDGAALREGLTMRVALGGEAFTCACVDDSSLVPVTDEAAQQSASSKERQTAVPEPAYTQAPGELMVEWGNPDTGDDDADAAPAETPDAPEWNGNTPDADDDSGADMADAPDANGTTFPDIGEYAGSYAVRTSSVRVNNDRSIIVDGYCAADGNLDTAWNSYKETAGAWISLSVQDGSAYWIAGFRIASGYWKSSRVYQANARPRTLDVYCDERYVGTFQLADAKDYQTFWFAEPVEAASVRFAVGGGYGGTTYSDCAITEIELLGPMASKLSRQSLGAWGTAVRMLGARVSQGNAVVPGERGLAAAGLQLLLRDGFGMLYGAVDGDYGAMTRNAVNGLASAMSATLGEKLLPMTEGVVDRNYWQNMLAYMDVMGEIPVATYAVQPDDALQGGMPSGISGQSPAQSGGSQPFE